MYSFRGNLQSAFGTPRDYAWVFGTIFAITASGSLLSENYNSWGYIILLGILALSTRVPPIPAIAAAILGSAAWDYFFVPPRYSFRGIHVEQGLLLLTYFVVAIVGSQLTALKAASDRTEMLAKSEQLHAALLDSVAHELKTPLAVLQTAVEGLGSRSLESRDLVIAEIKDAVTRMNELVNNLLNQLRLDAGIVAPRFDWCSVEELTAHAIKQARGRIAGRSLTVAIPEQMPLIYADEVMLAAALTQIVANAAVHTEPDVAIHIDAGTADDNTKAFIRVTDKGAGISPEMRKMLFTRFRHGPGGGLGLGLSIARGLMSANQGDITYEPNGSAGSRFTLWIPLKEDTNPVK